MTAAAPSRLPPTMVAIGAAFFVGLALVVAVTIGAVLNADDGAPPTIDALAFPAGVSVLDTHLLCSAEACEGEGAVIGSAGHDHRELRNSVEHRFLVSGWASVICGEETVCLASGDLRAKLTPWASMTDPATAAVRSAIEDSDVDQSDLVYVRVWRCGIVSPCE